MPGAALDLRAGPSPARNCEYFFIVTSGSYELSPHFAHHFIRRNKNTKNSTGSGTKNGIEKSLRKARKR